jgi:hypothetical protein
VGKKGTNRNPSGLSTSFCSQRIRKLLGIVTWLFKRFQTQKPQDPAQPTKKLLMRNRKRMLESVLHEWVKPGLERSLYHIAHRELGLKETPDAIGCFERKTKQP